MERLVRLLPIGDDTLRPECGLVSDFRPRALTKESGKVEEVLVVPHHRRTAARKERIALGAGVLPAHRDASPLLKGQRAFVLEKNDALLGKLSCKGAAHFLGALYLPLCLHLFDAVDKIEHARGAGVKFLIRKDPRVIVCNELFVVLLVEGEFDVEPCFASRRAVAHRLPVGIDRAVEAEFLAQDAEALLVFRSVHAVDAVVGAHGGDGLCLGGKFEGF